MPSKAKIGGCKKRLRKKKVSKGLRRSIAKPYGSKPSGIGAQRHQ